MIVGGRVYVPVYTYRDTNTKQGTGQLGSGEYGDTFVTGLNIETTPFGSLGG